MAKTLTRTSIAVTINGNDYSKYVMFPFKVSNLLDEQLDEASLTLIGVSDKNFKPLTDVIVTLTNDNKEKSYYMLVASDKADEIPTGSGKYKHELYLIEQTKYLECFIVRSIGYLNPLEKEYVPIPSIPDGKIDFTGNISDKSDMEINSVFKIYNTPVYIGDFTVYGLSSIADEAKIGNGWEGKSEWRGIVLAAPTPSIEIYIDNTLIFRKEALMVDDEVSGYPLYDMTPLNEDINLTVKQSGVMSIKYINCGIENNNREKADFTITYYIAVI